MGRIVLSSADPIRIDAYRVILDYYGVDYRELEACSLSLASFASIIYLVAEVDKGMEKMIRHDIKQLDKPQVLRKSFHGSGYLRKLLSLGVSDAVGEKRIA